MSQSPNFIGQNYTTILNQSFNTLLSSFHNQKTPDFSDFSSTFHKLLQSKSDPPIETIWVYSSLAYFTKKQSKIQSLDQFQENPSKIESLDQFKEIKELFQLVVSCSSSCNPLKCIVLITPVIYNLHKFVVSLKGGDLGSKRERRVRREVKGLVSSVIGYISVCCEGLDGTGFDDLEESLIRPLGDLVRIWIDDEEGLIKFFPLLSGGIVEDFGGGLSELAGFVVAEAFLLKLCLEFGEGELSKEGENELRCWIIGSITGLKNSFFFRTLLMMLSEPSLPVTSLMDPRAETTLRKILYDAVILAEYTFLAPDKLAVLPIKHVMGLNMSRLVLIHEVVESLRKEAEDQAKLISYLNAFSTSSLPSQLIKWVRCESGIDVKANGPNGTSPKALLKWILNLENRGLRIFDDSLSKFRSKLILDNIVGYPEEAVLKVRKNSDADILFYIDKKGAEEEGEEEGNDEDEDMTSVNAAFVAAAQDMQSPENGGTKRKAKDVEKQLKYLKYGRHDHSDISREKATNDANADSSSDSDVDNPSSDEEMEA